MDKIHIIFDGPPGPEAGRFVEVENTQGKSINAGEWRRREDGYWELVIDLNHLTNRPHGKPLAGHKGE